MDSCDWEPFIKAALERNPVSIEAAQHMSVPECYEWLAQMEDESIYPENRLAQPEWQREEASETRPGVAGRNSNLVAGSVRRRLQLYHRGLQAGDRGKLRQ